MAAEIVNIIHLHCGFVAIGKCLHEIQMKLFNQIKIHVCMKGLLFLTALLAVSGFESQAQYPLFKINEAVGKAENQVSDKGVLVIKEDFSKLIAGTENAPSDENILNQYEQIGEQYTQEPNWGGFSVKSAGGCIYIGTDSEQVTGTNFGWLYTPTLNLYPMGGEFDVYFRARIANDSELQSDKMVVGDCIAQEREVELSKDWKEFKVSFANGESWHWVKFYPGNSTVLLDDIEIYLSGIDTPSALNPKNYEEGDSFIASWTAVETAESYLLSVFTTSNNAEDGERSYFIQDKELTSLSYDVTGLDKAKTYFYSVKAKRGNRISNESNVQKARWILTKLDTPETLPATDVTDQSFTANWKQVTNAEGYAVSAFIDHKNPADGYYTLLETDFSRIETDATIENPELMTDSQVSFNKFTNRSDWGAVMPCYANGIFGLDYYYEPTYIQSPLLDLSTGDGKLNVEFTALSNGPEELIVSIAEIRDGYMMAVDADTLNVAKEWTEYSVDLEKGGKQSYIVILAKTTNGQVFFDNLKVSKYMKAGESIIVPKDYYEGSELSKVFDTSDKVDGDRYYYNLRAYGYSEDGSVVASNFSKNQYADSGEGSVENIGAAKAKAWVSGGLLHVENPENADVMVFDIAGRNVFSEKSPVVEAALDVAGMYIVKVGNEIFKVINK